MTHAKRTHSEGLLVLTVAVGLSSGSAAAAGLQPGPDVTPGINSRVSVPAAAGDWPLWRGNPQRTGLQGFAGRISKPGVKWRHFLGGSLTPDDALLIKAGGRLKEDLLFVNVAGRLEAFSLDGTARLSRDLKMPMRLVATADIDRDGTPELVATSVGLSGSQVFVLSVVSGEILWKSPQCDGQVGAVKIFQKTAQGNAVLLWLPAASSRLTAFDFSSSVRKPKVLWQAVIDDFVSDPYTNSDIAVGDLDGSGRQKIVVAGARGQVLLIVFDAETGLEITRRSHTGEVGGAESGGSQQLLKIMDLDGRYGNDVLLVSGYDSGNTYMFQGAATYSPTNPKTDFIFESFPTGLVYSAGSVADFNGDGKADVLVSRFDPETAHHDLLLLSLPSLHVEWRVENFALSGIVETGPGRHWVIGYEDQGTEGRSGTGCFSAVEIVRGRVERRWSVAATASLGQARSGFAMSDDTTNDPPPPVVLPGDRNQPLLVTRFESVEGSRDGRIVLLDLSTGESVAEFAGEEGVHLSLLAAKIAGDLASSRLVVAGNDGRVSFLDGNLKVLAAVSRGVLGTKAALNGHASERAVVAPGPTGDKKTVFVRDSRERVLRLDRSRVAGGGWEVRGEAIWNQGVNQELVVIPGEDGTARVVVRGFEEIHPILAALAPDGTLFWQVQPGATAGVSRNEAMPIGINVGRDQTTGETRLIFAAGTSNQFPQTLQAIDATSGRNLWRSDTGTYWDGVVTCWDVDGDGIDDAIVNWNTLKCIVVNGRTGETLAEGTRLPPFRELGEVNYNGVPIVASGHEGRIEIVNSEDDAHLAGLTLHGSSAAGASCEAEVRWSLEQSVIDDERRSMSALAPDPRWGWIVGTGSRRGVMRAVRGDTGQEIWRVALWNGNAKPEDGDHPENPLSAVLAMDVNGDGRTDFVVGGGDGWLYTIDSGSGRLVWSLDLKAPVLNPIAADFDGVGSSEILVPTGDGYLHAIGGR